MAEERVQRRLAAILVADVVGYSRLMEVDEEGTRARLRSLHSELVAPRIAADGGRIVKTTGDGILVEFPSAVDAVHNALAIQTAMPGRDANLPEDRRIAFRVGINVGDVIVEGDDIHGDGVNVAARLEAMCEPGSVYVSGSVFEQVTGKIDAAFDDLGEQKVKNISHSVRVFRARAVREPAGAPAATAEMLPLPDKPSIAVLPFENMSGDPEQEYFSDGIVEDLITSLSKIGGLLVIARNSTLTYKGQAVDVAEVSQKLGVRTVLEGSVRKAGNRVRITAQLIDGATRGHLWAEQYDRDLDDVFAVQDDVTSEIVSALKVKLTEGERARLGPRQVLPAEVYDLLLRGREQFLFFTKEGNEKARHYFEKARKAAPDHAEVYARLAQVYVQDSMMGWTSSRREVTDHALELIDKAVELDPTPPFVHGTLGLLYLWRGEHDKAIAESETWIELDPNNADAYLQLANALSFSGEAEKALPLLNESMRLNPNYSFITIFILGHVNYQLGKLDEAVTFLERSTTRNPDFAPGFIYLVAVYSELGEEDKARALAAKLIREGVESFLPRLRELYPYKYEKEIERLADALHKAGLSA